MGQNQQDPAKNYKCYDSTVAFVGGLVGVTLEIDMSTIHRPSSIRAKIGCHSFDELPATAEGCLGGRFYRFQYEVEEVLVRNPVVEEEVIPMPKSEASSPEHTPKHKCNESETGGHSRSPMLRKLAPSLTVAAKPIMCCHLNERRWCLLSVGGGGNPLLIEKLALLSIVLPSQIMHKKWIVPLAADVAHDPIEHVPVINQEVQVNAMHSVSFPMSFVELLNPLRFWRWMVI